MLALPPSNWPVLRSSSQPVVLIMVYVQEYLATVAVMLCIFLLAALAVHASEGAGAVRGWMCVEKSGGKG